MTALMPGEELATVLVTVKAYPNPSESYGETVCVAGVRLDRGAPEWIRLYPVKFRNVEQIDQFKKYEVIQIPGTYRGRDDPRPESFKPRQDGLVHLRKVDPSKNWRERRHLLGDLIGQTTTCELRTANPKGHMTEAAPSLGLIKPNVTRVRVLPGEPWSAKEQSKIDKASAPDLFGNEMPALEAPPFVVRYEYRCETHDCPGHDQKILDWELGQAGRKWSTEYPADEVPEKIRQKWEDMFLDPKRDTHFFIGNQARRRGTFSVLGVWYPEVEDPMLF